MKNKISLLVLGIFSLLLIAGFASATISFSGVPSTLSRTGTSATITVTSNSSTDETVTFSGLSSITTANGKTITFTVPVTITVNSSASKTVTIPYTVPSDSQFNFGTAYNTTLTAASSNTISTNLTFENIPSEYLDDGNLELSMDSFKVEKGYGDEYQWYPLDEVSASITVDNRGSDKVKNIVVKYGLYDTKNGKWIFKNSESSFSLNDGNDKTLDIKFKIDALSKFDVDNSADYLLYAWATGDDEETGNKTSIVNSEDIEMQFDNDLVIADNIQITESAGCGQEVQITADITNIGVDDQNDVYVTLINTDLGLNKKISIGDIDSLSNKNLDYTFTVPENTKEGIYQIGLTVYDDNDDVYKTNLNDDEIRIKTPLEVKGSCSTVPQVSIAAELQSASAVAGKEIVIKATLQNTGSSKATLDLGISGYADWATLTDIDKKTLTLDAGASAEVLIKLNLNKDISGEKSLDIVVTEGDKIITQPVKVTVGQDSVFPGINGLFSGFVGNNWYLWGIGALNVLLVFIIILVAVKVSKKKEEVSELQ
jgi:hypothetical protein